MRVVAPGVRSGGRGAVGFRRDDGIEIEHEAAREIAESLERARLGEKRRAASDRRRPRVLVPPALHTPHDVHTPALHAVGREPERLERNLDLDLVAGRGHASFRREDVVGRQVCDLAAALERAEKRAAAIAAAFDERAVGLDAQRIDAEHQRAPIIVEGVEKDLNGVVCVDAVAVGQCRVDAAGRRVRLDAEVDRGRRVPHEHLGRIVGRPAVDR